MLGNEHDRECPLRRLQDGISIRQDGLATGRGARVETLSRHGPISPSGRLIAPGRNTCVDLRSSRRAVPSKWRTEIGDPGICRTTLAVSSIPFSLAAGRPTERGRNAKPNMGSRLPKGGFGFVLDGISAPLALDSDTPRFDAEIRLLRRWSSSQSTLSRRATGHSDPVLNAGTGSESCRRAISPAITWRPSKQRKGGGLV